MTLVFLVSGSGTAAGKTTFAETLVGGKKIDVWSIAAGIRDELTKQYPNYRWYDKSQEYKSKTIVPEYRRGYTIREVLYEYGQEKCKHYPEYWVARLIDKFSQSYSTLLGPAIAIDDVRKLCELHTLRHNLPNCIHFHIENPDAVKEPMFDNDQLRLIADYRVQWKDIK